MSDKIAAEVGTALHRLSHAIAAPVDSLLAGIEALKGERDEALAEVERLRRDLVEARLLREANDRRVNAMDELRAELEQLQKLRDVEVRQLCRQWETAADAAHWFAAERDQARAEVERMRVAVDDATHFYHQALEERDAALAVIERVRQVARDLRPSTLSGLLERALDGGESTDADRANVAADLGGGAQPCMCGGFDMSPAVVHRQGGPCYYPDAES